MQATADLAGPSPGAGVLHLPALLPTRASLLALTRPLSGESIAQICGDPAAVLLLLRDPAASDLRTESLAELSTRPESLTRALVLLTDPSTLFLDIAHPAVRTVVSAARTIAIGAEARARDTNGRVDPLRAAVCGLLAPLGWLALAAIAPDHAGACLADGDHRTQPLETQGRHWSLDQDAIARRLARRWSLPNWACDVLGRLRLNADLIADLGGSRALFEIVRLAVIDAAREGHDLGLVSVENVGSPGVASLPEWTDPRSETLLPDLLRLAIENRHLAGNVQPTRDLEEENDRLHRTLAHRLTDEDERLLTGRLQALAEMAAGAGHEINNPLAVISGQAQYLLGRRDRCILPEAMPLVVQSLETVIGQTRRIHTLLRQMMMFARPPVPNRRPTDLGRLMAEVAESQAEFANQRNVRVEVALGDAVRLSLDVEMMRTALTAVVRNAIEAAPAEGWVRIGTEQPTSASPVEVVVEDSGPGPLPEQVPFLFDPFYSGRSAGRGKGLGLPVAWQLVRQHGGEVRFVPTEGGPTRFVLRLPGAPCGQDERNESSGEAA